MADFDAYGRTVEVWLILGVAEALRHEFGIGIDAHTGGIGNEAGVVNRSFRAVARRILKAIVPKSEDLDAVSTWVLRRAALRHLAVTGVVDQLAQSLIDSEPGLGDAWLAYLTLAPESVIDDFLGQGPDGG